MNGNTGFLGVAEGPLFWGERLRSQLKGQGIWAREFQSEISQSSFRLILLVIIVQSGQVVPRVDMSKSNGKTMGPRKLTALTTGIRRSSVALTHVRAHQANRRVVGRPT